MALIFIHDSDSDEIWLKYHSDVVNSAHRREIKKIECIPADVGEKTEQMLTYSRAWIKTLNFLRILKRNKANYFLLSKYPYYRIIFLFVMSGDEKIVEKSLKLCLTTQAELAKFWDEPVSTYWVKLEQQISKQEHFLEQCVISNALKKFKVFYIYISKKIISNKSDLVQIWRQRQVNNEIVKF